MYLFGYGLVAMAIAFVFLPPGVSLGRIYWSLLIGIVTGIIAWISMPVMAWDFGSNWLLLFFVGVAIVAVARLSEEETLLSLVPILITVGVSLVALLTSWPLQHSARYRALLGEPVVSEFTADVSPVDIGQVRRVDQDLAIALGSKRIEEQPGLGSRVDLGAMNIQMVNGCFTVIDGGDTERTLCFDHELVWVGPLTHDDIFKWWSNDTTPAYIIVSAVDSAKTYMVTELKKLDTEASAAPAKMGNKTPAADFDKISLRYLKSGAYFGDLLERHVRLRGYQSAGLTDYTFEIDDTGRPYWVISKFDKKVGFSGAEVTGVLVVDAQTGEIKEYNVGDAPTWIDRIQPEDIVTDQVDDWGQYVQGFWNSVFAEKDVVKTTPGMSLVYGADGRSYWYSGLQSAGSDTGTNSFVLVDTRTKQVRRYMISGANEKAAKGSAENAPGVREANFYGTDPILYNVGGEPTYFLTLKGTDGLVKMFAFVSVRNYETVGVGRSVNDALRDYQNALVRSGSLTKIDDVVNQETLHVEVLDVVQIDDTFYLRVEGQNDREYYGTNDVSPELKWARPGSTVEMVVNKGAQKSVPIIQIDVVGIGLTGK